MDCRDADLFFWVKEKFVRLREILVIYVLPDRETGEIEGTAEILMVFHYPTILNLPGK